MKFFKTSIILILIFMFSGCWFLDIDEKKWGKILQDSAIAMQYRHEGARLLNEEKYTEAIAAFSKAIDGGYFHALEDRSKAYLKLGRTEKAIENLESLIEYAQRLKLYENNTPYSENKNRSAGKTNK